MKQIHRNPAQTLAVIVIALIAFLLAGVVLGIGVVDSLLSGITGLSISSALSSARPLIIGVLIFLLFFAITVAVLAFVKPVKKLLGL